MEIISELRGSFSSKVFLVKVDGKKYVLKTCTTEEVISEKNFHSIVSKNNTEVLNYFDNLISLNSNQILLEYVKDSKILGDDFSENNCKKWGILTKKIHNIKFHNCFRYNAFGKKNNYDWNKFLEEKTKKAFLKASENNNYGFNTKELEKIENILQSLLNIEIEKFH